MRPAPPTETGGGTPAATLEELQRIVPTEQIETQAQADPGRGGSWAVEPATVEELVDVLRWATERHAAIFTRHPRPTDPDVCGPRPRIYLRGRRMRRVKDLDIVSGTITVQTGVTMKELDQQLKDRGYTTGLPTRPWRQESLGAVLAAALDSHWGPHFGAMEGEVVGLGVVFPDGTATTSRPAPRKAVGPDFDRLFLGSRGRFGILYEVTLRIYPGTERLVLSFGAPSLSAALDAVREAFDYGLEPRAVEILTPAADRAWGRKRVGLTDALPILVLVEPWAGVSARPVDDVERWFAERLVRLEPPAGWDVHEGLLPPSRAWTSPVVGVSWAELEHLAADVGDAVPSGLWVVRMSRHGGHASVAPGMRGPVTERVRDWLAARQPPADGPWRAIQRALVRKLDPHGILNPSAEDAPAAPAPTSAPGGDASRGAHPQEGTP